MALNKIKYFSKMVMKKEFLVGILILCTVSFVFANDKAIEKIARQEKISVEEVKKTIETGCDSGGTVSMTQCGRFRFMIADIELNDIYARVKKQLTTKSAREKLKKTQRAWITFRDTVCEYESEGWEGGTGYNMVYIGCMHTYTDERIKHLREYLDCKEPGCPGIKE
jgi:uncharacterized protein YecT (DUF1311 family)